MMYWLIVILFLVFVEVSSASLTSIWFIASAIVSLVLSIFIDSFLIQFAVFVILGTILLITTRKTMLKFLKNKNEKTNLDRVLNMKAIVTEEIIPNEIGEVKVDGKRWSAYSKTKIKKDTLVKILKIDGVKLEVEEEK